MLMYVFFLLGNLFKYDLWKGKFDIEDICMFVILYR